MNEKDRDALVEIRVRITRRQRRLLKIYQLQRDLPTKDAALQEILQKFFEEVVARGRGKMGNPSVKTIIERLGTRCNSKETAGRIRALMAATSHKEIDQALDSMNNLLGGYGVEALRDTDWGQYYNDIGLLYVNVGETYAPTILYDTRLEKWIVGSWGDYVEHYYKRFSI